MKYSFLAIITSWWVKFPELFGQLVILPHSFAIVIVIVIVIVIGCTLTTLS